MEQGLELPYPVKPMNPALPMSWMGPYVGATLQEAKTNALNNFPISFRRQTVFVHLIVAGKGLAYWFADGNDDSDFIEFKPDAGAQPFDLTAYITTAPVAANEAAATAQNLAPFTLYKTPGGELRYKLPPVSSGSLQYNTILNSNTSLI